jgi:5-methylthioribose kinase
MTTYRVVFRFIASHAALRRHFSDGSLLLPKAASRIGLFLTRPRLRMSSSEVKIAHIVTETSSVRKGKLN